MAQKRNDRRMGEVGMFARKVAARLKTGALTEFTKLMECEVLPWLRKREGFLDLIILAAPDGREVTTISFWDHEGDAQAYDSSGYPEVLRMLAQLLDAAPYVKTFHVVSSTCHEGVLVREPQENLSPTSASAPASYRSCETGA